MSVILPASRVPVAEQHRPAARTEISPAQSRPAQSRPAQSRPAQSRPAQTRPATPSAAPSAAPVALSVTSDGTTYSVASGPDHTLVATRDGESWKTWQLTIPSDDATDHTTAAIALQASVSTAARAAARETSAPNGVDRSA